jgi:hypothetical protein
MFRFYDTWDKEYNDSLYLDNEGILWKYEHGYDDLVQCDNERYIIEQCLGRSKNGKTLYYVGDIVGQIEGVNGCYETIKGVLKFNEESFSDYAEYLEGFWKNKFSYCWRKELPNIVGNIHD